ncbi:MAG: hypothetical protein ABI818_06045 [Acidobacteriota bacterium]
MLQTAPEIESPPAKFAIDLMFAAMAGATRYVLESGASAAMVRNLRQHLVVLCQAYMAAQFDRRPGHDHLLMTHGRTTKS